MLTDKVIYRESGQYDKEIMQRLYLSNQGINRICNLEACVSLVELVLSYNEISLISGLETLVNLKVLDLSFNKLRKIENLSGLTMLESLDMRGNQISSLSDIADIANMKSLKALNLKGVDGEDSNPVCGSSSYSSTVMAYLPSLDVLDGGHVQIREAFGTIEDELAKLRPDPTICATPPSEPWFSAADLSDGDVISAKAKASMESIAQLEKTIEDMLREDCGHLLRKAQAKASAAAIGGIPS